MCVVCGRADIDKTFKFRGQHLGVVGDIVLDIDTVFNQYKFLAVSDEEVATGLFKISHLIQLLEAG